MRTDLDDVGDPFFEQRAHGVGEQHRSAQVVNPVLGIHLRAAQPGHPDGGHQGCAALPGPDGRKRGEQVLGQLVHLWAVGRVVDVDQPAEGALGLEELLECQHRLAVTGKHA